MASLHHDDRDDRDDVLKALKCEIWTKLQKWWELFGRYWLIVNRHNDDNVKLMGWSMNGARHGMVDVCGENVSIMKPVQDRRCGIRLLTGGTIYNHSKLLKMELGQQIPIKSPHKMKRDLIKTARALDPAYELIPNRSCWYDQRILQVLSLNAFDPLEYSLPNSKWGFFDECITQKFFDRNLDNGRLITYGNENNQLVEDIYGNVNSYQCHCMDISGELMTFSVGGSRHFENNLPLENSPLWTRKNLAHNTHHRDVFRNCKYVYGYPLFRHHYEVPTNPTLKGDVVSDPINWWDINDRESDIFEDTDEYGYVSTQLTHLPKFIGYDVGNVLSYLPIYDLNVPKEVLYMRKRTELTPRVTCANFLHQSHTLPFKFRTDQVAVAQRDVLYDPSVYVVNRKSLLVNKPHVFYNNDSSDVHCLPLVRNTLK